MTDVRRRADPVAVERILGSLPAWFGIPSATAAYVEAADVLPSYLAVDDEQVVGVALVERHFPEAAELHLIAVAADRRGSGVGTLLVEAVERDLVADGVRLVQVKTVGASFADEGYAETRAFYRARGFLPLEERHDLGWDGPTLILVKTLA